MACYYLQNLGSALLDSSHKFLLIGKGCEKQNVSVMSTGTYFLILDTCNTSFDAMKLLNAVAVFGSTKITCTVVKYFAIFCSWLGFIGGLNTQYRHREPKTDLY